MIMSDGLLRVFWPYDLPRSSAPGVIVGWRNSELDLFVLTVLEDVEVSFDLVLVPIRLRNCWLTCFVRKHSLEMLTMRCEPGSYSVIVRILSCRYLPSAGDL